MRIAEIALFTERPDELIAFYERVLETPPGSRWPMRRLGVEARDYDWGRSAYLRDPDGRLVVTDLVLKQH